MGILAIEPTILHSLIVTVVIMVKDKADCDFYCVDQFERLFETEYNSIYDLKTGETEFIASLCRTYSRYSRLYNSASRIFQ